MYTRCPSCKSEISFEPPANAASLPEGSKYRIKCPSCGVTIGVKIPKQDADSTYSENPNAPAFEPINEAGEAEPAKLKQKPAKKSGRIRNVFVLFFSLVFIALSIVAYLATTNVIDVNTVQWLSGIESFDGISAWEQVCLHSEDLLAPIFEQNIGFGLLYIFPLFLFTFAGINAIVSFISLCCGKYGRVYNLLMSTLLGFLAIFTMFYPLMMITAMAQIVNPAYTMPLDEYFTNVLDSQMYFLIVGACVGFVQFVFSLGFLKSLKRK